MAIDMACACAYLREHVHGNGELVFTCTEPSSQGVLIIITSTMYLPGFVQQPGHLQQRSSGGAGRLVNVASMKISVQHTSFQILCIAPLCGSRLFAGGSLLDL